MRELVYRAGAITRKPNSKMDAGILELKMKERLRREKSHLAIGLHIVRNSFSENGSASRKTSLSPQKPKNASSSLLPEQRAKCAPCRDNAMGNMLMTNATKLVVNRQVQSCKREESVRKKNLPPISGAFKKRHVAESNFPTAYKLGQLPLLIEHKTGGNALRWTKPIDDLDYSFLLPLFFEGIREQQEPYRYLSHQGVHSLLDHAITQPQKLHLCLHKIIQPIRSALNTRDVDLISKTLKFIQHLLLVDGIGVALLPYYRQLLPIFNLFKNMRHNLGDAMDYSQRNGGDLCDSIQKTLEMMEETGGPNAYVNLKYMIPTYEGTFCVM